MISASHGSPTFTIITCHFGSFEWIENLTSRVLQFSGPDDVPPILVADQSRVAGSAARLSSVAGVRRVLAYEVDEAQVAVLGHDHPRTLDQLCREPVSTSHLIVMDSDTCPTDARWLDEIRSELADVDCIVAADRSKVGLSHPCFMVIPTASAADCHFSEGVLEVALDTGRLIGLRLAQKGLRVRVLPSQRAFGGLRGDMYLSRTIYHHGSGSFSSSSDQRLLSQVNSWEDEFFKRRVLSGRWSMPWVSRWRVVARRRIRRVWRLAVRRRVR